MAATPVHAARVLGLNLRATVEDVRQVRRKMALKYHPDQSVDSLRATRHMARINAAADTLTEYLKNQKITAKSWTHPSYKDFAAKKPQRTRTTKQSSSKANSPKAQKTADANTQRSTPKATVAGINRQPLRSDTRSSAEIALVRYASQSYCNILERIGKKPTGPRIDAVALAH